jgi:hypothetical protein
MNATARPLDARTLAIGVLSITACILFVGFLLISSSPTPAYGFGQNDRGGDYIILTQQLTGSSEALIVIDAASHRMVLYGFDITSKAIVPIQGIPLDELPGMRPGWDAEGGGRRAP